MLSILTGFLVRADGWGGSRFFSVWTCSALFGLLCLLWYPPITALACGLAFLLFRLPGFRNGGLSHFFIRRLPYNFRIKWLAPEDGWQHWRNMFIRGVWPTAIGFTLIALTTGNVFAPLLCFPFAAIYATIYSGGYKYLPQTVLGFDKHVWIEHASGWAFVWMI